MFGRPRLCAANRPTLLQIALDFPAFFFCCFASLFNGWTWKLRAEVCFQNQTSNGMFFAAFKPVWLRLIEVKLLA